MRKAKSASIFHPSNRHEPVLLPYPLRYFETEVTRPELPYPERRDDDYRLHAANKPAVLFEDGGEEWWRHGRAHREGDEPAIYISDSNKAAIAVAFGMSDGQTEHVLLPANTEIWCKDGLIHRDDGAAIQNHGDELDNRLEFWCRGRRHNAMAPALITSKESRWYYHGLLHREDGPAFELTTSGGSLIREWYWYGDMLDFNHRLSEEFPIKEPLTEFILGALADSRLPPDLAHPGVAKLIDRCCVEMPDLRLLISGLDVLVDWDAIRTRVARFIANPVSFMNEQAATLPLPDLGEI